MFRSFTISCWFLSILLTVPLVQANYADRAEVKAFAQRFAAEHKQDVDSVLAILSQGKYQQGIIDAISKPAERVLNWGDYRRIFIEQKRLDNGVAFGREHQQTLMQVAQQFQVEPAIILAILGVETRYGKVAGSYRVLDALLTLGFDYPPRASFFRGQLEQLLLLGQEQSIDVSSLVGSYAGAMGFGQFIPSSYRAYAVDFDGDKKADIWQNPDDAMASVANYFKQHKWRYGEPVAIQLQSQAIPAELISKGLKPNHSVASLRQAGLKIPKQIDAAAKVSLIKLSAAEGDEYWLGFENFYAITRYNHSRLYAMAVFQLSELIRFSRAM